MASSPRLRATSAVAAVALLGGSWLVTHRDAQPTADPASTSAARSTTIPAAEAATDPSPTPLRAGVRAGLRFRDVTAAAGLAAPQSAAPSTGDDVMTGGVAVADVDGDGDQDILLTRIGLPNRLMRNDGRGHFTDIAATAGLSGTDQRSGYAAAVWADVDGDGDLDVLLTGAGRTRHVLYVNDGQGHFTDETEARGLGGAEIHGLLGTASYGAAFDDWDHDGDLDLVVLQWYTSPVLPQLARIEPSSGTGSRRRDLCRLAADRRAEPPAVDEASRSQVLRNDGSGHFADVTAGSGIDVAALVGFQPVFTDIDGDGWNDLFITGDVCTSRIYRNLEGRGFADVTADSGTGTDENGMGSVLADVDGDGNLDWFVTSISYPTSSGRCPVVTPTVGCSGNRLFLGDGRGQFTDATDRFGVRDGYWGWGAAASDLNDDGHVDLVMTNGMLERRADGEAVMDGPDAAVHRRFASDPTRLWLGTGAGPFPEAAEAVGLDDRGSGKGLVTFDADGDGDLEVLVATNGGHPILYRNDTPAGDTNHRLTIRLRQPDGNRFAIGAVVRVDLGDGSPPRPLVVRAGGSFQSGDPTDLHVGLGRIDRVARIEVRWPGDPEPQVLTDVAADRVLTITKGS